MQVDWTPIINLVSALAWPIVAVVALLLLRKPLAELVTQIARRARKLSIYEVSIELATLPELPSAWTIGSVDVRKLTSAQVFDAPSIPLFQELLKPAGADYVVVNLGKGREWLTSRLFVFALVLGTVTELRAFVFLETAGGVRRRFVGVATPINVQRALASRYPWLEEAYLRAATPGQPLTDTAGSPKLKAAPPLFVVGAGQECVSRFVKQFVENIQRKTSPPPDEEQSHMEIAGLQSQTWERSHWIDGERLERDLAGYLEDASCEDSPDATPNTLVDAVARRNGTFVALVDRDRRFVGLVDRHLLLDQVRKMQEAGRTNSGTRPE